MVKKMECVTLGIKFNSVQDAARWVKENTIYKHACFDHITFHVPYVPVTAYGYEWQWIKREKPVLYLPRKSRNTHRKKSIWCIGELPDGDALGFESISSAIKWLVEIKNHPKAAQSCISMCCQGKIKTAYGYQWKYMD